MARKAWSELSPAYRKRLESHGISARGHSSGASLRLARGHGVHTPSTIRQRAQRDQRALERAQNAVQHGRKVSARDRAVMQMDVIRAELERRAAELGYFPSQEIDRWIMADDGIGPERTAIVLEWQKARHDAFEELQHSTPATAAGKRNKQRQIGYIKNRHHVPGTFSQTFPDLETYVKSTRGYEAWDTIWEEWWDSVSDLIQFAYYR